MNMVDLTLFCARNPHDLRFDIGTPHLINGFVYATDGSILIRCVRELCTGPAAEHGRMPNNLDAQFESVNHVLEWQPPPPIDESCRVCAGVGLIRDPCSRCIDTGWILDGGLKKCTACETESSVYNCHRCKVSTGGFHIARWYSNTLHTLPNVAVGIAEAACGRRALCFRFLGGSGLVMPLKDE
jgi:hypothetical protein